MVGGVDLSTWVASIFLLSLRTAPLFMFAPPFTLTRVPRLFLALLGIGLAIGLAGASPEHALVQDLSATTLVIGGARELMLGLIPVLVLNLMFAALYVAGRTLDIQSGFGLALLIDPATRGQTPLVGTLLAYLAGAMFFAMNGHHEMLRFFAASLEVVPLGAAHAAAGFEALSAYIFVIFLIGFGVAGAAILVLFVADIVIALLSRTVPQMNALILGIQVKAALLLITLPVVASVSGVMLAQMVTTALRAMARMV